MKILVIAAHPDDEVLGCGGTLLKLKDDNEIFLAYGANGVSGYPKHSAKEIAQRKKAMLKVAKHLRAKVLDKSFPFKDQRLDQEDFNKIVSWVEKKIAQVGPDRIYTHWSNDLNRDHRIIAEAVIVAARPWKNKIKEIYAFEVVENTFEGSNLSGRPFLPNIYEEIDFKAKLDLMGEYQTELDRSGKWIKGVNALSSFRGFAAGCDHAEAYVLIRKINDQN